MEVTIPFVSPSFSRVEICLAGWVVMGVFFEDPKRRIARRDVARMSGRRPVYLKMNWHVARNFARGYISLSACVENMFFGSVSPKTKRSGVMMMIFIVMTGSMVSL